MKNIGLYLLIYNLLLLPCIGFDWYAKYQPIIDLFDTPFYFIGAYYFFFKNKTLNNMQKDYLKTCLVYLIFKFINLYFINLSFEIYIFWNVVIICLPLISHFERKLYENNN